MGYMKDRWIESMEPKPHEWERRWIPVDESLPESGEPVLCSDDFDGWCEVLQHEGLAGWVDIRGNQAYATPTHWMQLPKPPAAKGPAQGERPGKG